MDIPAFKILLDNNTAQIFDLTAHAVGNERLQSEENSWDVAQILEHCLILEGLVYKILLKSQGKFAETPEIIGLEKQRKYASTPPLRKVKSPENALPTGSHGTKEQILEKFKANRAFLLSEIDRGEIVIDNRVFLHPFFGEITMSDWMHLLISHTERHMIQLREILSDNQIKNQNQ